MIAKSLRDKMKYRINLFKAKRNLDRFHKLHEQKAFEAIRTAEAVNGFKLTKHMRKMSDEYAVEVFGDKRYAPWLYFYSVIQGKFKEGWIPANFYARYVLPDEGLIGVAITKTFSKIVLKTNALPDIAYRINGIFFDKYFNPISSLTFKNLIGQNAHVIMKNNHSLRARGVSKLSKDEIDEKLSNTQDDCVFQQVVDQHPFFDDIVVGPLITIRITTVRNPKGSIEYRGAYLKIGRQGDKLYHSDDGIFVLVQKKDGLISQFGYYANFKRITNHPDTNYPFANTYIPRFQDAVEICADLHKSIPHFPIIGWDVAVDRDENIKIIEWNAGMPHPALKSFEATIGPCFTGLNWEQLKRKEQ